MLGFLTTATFLVKTSLCIATGFLPFPLASIICNKDHLFMERKDDSPSSSIDSSSHPAFSTASSVTQPRSRDFSTDLSLGLSLLTSSPPDWYSKQRNQVSLTGHPRLFVKVYMEGIPIGRKLDLYAHDSYSGLIQTLGRMFRTSIMYPETARVPCDHVLTYEDGEGDWMMVGDVPWEYAFLLFAVPNCVLYALLC
ncbi:auxin-responsive protein IAA4-like isoform X1 [Musa acuminata AAA Group]|uniref:auxin-responsive protein IAA4-like isoform X1 n=1 Tax=Musa acuminata AAA Group TaxID=214697 RepID=UPI0031E44BCC